MIATNFTKGDFRALETRFAPENLPNNLKLVHFLQEWALKKNATPALNCPSVAFGSKAHYFAHPRHHQ
ncbi:hypothetical protein [Helicobacter gastrocanis]|uniref:hypothetical protein n=1 Tax=Helicobacter gastrocanis TaxID=2849641 RepID=UPI00325F99BE